MNANMTSGLLINDTYPRGLVDLNGHLNGPCKVFLIEFSVNIPLDESYACQLITVSPYINLGTPYLPDDTPLPQIPPLSYIIPSVDPINVRSPATSGGGPVSPFVPR